MRGLWRWWETKNGADVWWARVETSPGAWTDLSREDYAAQVGAPAFWDLPLKEDVVRDAAMFPGSQNDPLARVEQRMGEFSVVLLMGVGAIVMTLLIVGFVLLG